MAHTGHRPIMGHDHYHFEGWVDKKCSSCIDGTVDPTPSQPAAEETQQEEEHGEARVQGQKLHGSSSNS
ncbi:hypothetical protein V6N11_081002 [Hibiscus sabdariffa]|uniref:Uncharacterized protein n=1 Tax=Hibiscus sabdariffa TaxID=183260 RepID=A0ABR2QIQ5_9ROSI